MKNKNKMIKVAKLLIIVFMLLLAFSSYLSISGSNVTGISTLSDSEYTSTDNLMYKSQYTINDYPSRLIATEATIKLVPGAFSHFELEYEGKDDPIVEIIPKKYFYEIGNKTVVGQEYGFFINTTQVTNPYPCYFSTVLVFDITTNTDIINNPNNITTEVKPIFQYEYLCITPETFSFYVNGFIFYNENSQGNYVIPYPSKMKNDTFDKSIEFNITEKYYLKDISFGVSLFNEQGLNKGNTDYNPYEDTGFYFTSLDYGYNGKYREYGKFPAKDLGWNIADSFFYALGWVDVIPFIGTPTAAIGQVYDTISLGYSWGSFVNDTIDSQKGKILVSEKKVTTEFYYENKSDQLTYYKDYNNKPYLIKSAATGTNTNSDKSIWYGIGDNVTGYFRVNHSSSSISAANSTRFTNDIAVRIVDSQGDNIVDVGNGVTTHKINSAYSKNVNMETIQTISLLPNGENNFTFYPQHSSDYKIKINSNEYLKVKINSIEYVGYNLDISQYLSPGINSIKIYGNEKNLTGTLLIEPSSSLNNINIKGLDNYLLKVSSISGLKEVIFNKSDAKIQIFNADFYLLKNNATNNAVFNFNSQKYYVIITNNSSSIINGSLIISDISTVININSELNLDIQKGDKFTKFTPTTSGYYSYAVFNYSQADFNLSLFNSNSNITNTSTQKVNGVYLKYEVYLYAYNNYYFGYENANITNGSIQLILKQNTNIYDWYINGSKVLDNNLYLRQGDTFTASLKIGNKNIDSEINNLAEGQLEYKGSYWLVPYTAAVLSANTGKLGIAVENSLYCLNIFVIPYIDIQIYKNSNTSNTSNSFTWYLNHSNLNDQIKFSGRFVYNNGQSYPFSADYARNGIIYVPTNEQVGYNRDKAFANVIIDNVYYRQTTYYNNNWINNNYELYNSYPSQISNVKDQFYFAPYRMNMMFDGGDGGFNNPYQINNAWQLDNIRYMLETVSLDLNNPEYYEEAIASSYTLINNITTDSNYAFTPLPKMCGSFNSTGNKKTIIINNLKNGSNWGATGLFSELSWASISNICVDIRGESGTSSSAYERKGAIAGYSSDSSIINCDAKGQFINLAYNFKKTTIGGIVGEFSGGTMSNCTSSVIINTYGDAGGIAARMYSGTISNCSFTGQITLNYSSITNVNDNSNIGGIIGWQLGGSILSCNVIKSSLMLIYKGDKIEDIYLRPCIGLIIGRKSGGTQSNNTTSINIIDSGNLYSFKKGGFIGIGGTTYNQLEYVSGNNRYIGRES